MSLQKLKSLTRPVRETLEADNWTVRGLAGVSPTTLTKYNGIGLARAVKIVKEAKKVLPTLPEPEPPALPLDEPVSELDEQPRVSVRVKRIKDAGNES